MTKSAHTPGPWCLQLGSIDGDLIGTENRELAICKMVEYCGLPVATERLANARLIAAAPDLLEALEVIREAFKEYSIATGITIVGFPLQMVDAAIAKSRGEA